jgi:hypothetical protein
LAFKSLRGTEITYKSGFFRWLKLAAMMRESQDGLYKKRIHESDKVSLCKPQKAK